MNWIPKPKQKCLARHSTASGWIVITISYIQEGDDTVLANGEDDGKVVSYTLSKAKTIFYPM